MDDFYGDTCNCYGCNGIVHTIRRGDTLYLLSRYYNVTVDEIMRANARLNIYNLQVGDQICIPVGRPMPPTRPISPQRPMRPERPMFPDMPMRPGMPGQSEMPMRPERPMFPDMPMRPMPREMEDDED